jgi:FTR1 family protein
VAPPCSAWPFLAVVREGLETALFLFAAAGEAQPAQALLGAVTGLVLAALLGVAVYRGSRRLSLRAFFTVTNLVLVSFGVYLVWVAVGELGEVIGGEVFEVLGPIAAVAYGVLALLVLRRAGRTSDTPEAAPATSHRAA